MEKISRVYKYVHQIDGINVKECSTCHQVKRVECFYPKTKDGKQFQPRCISCEKTFRRTDTNRKYISAKKSARRRNIDFRITREDWIKIKEATNCECCGKLFRKETINDNSPDQQSLDRVDNNVGYENENCKAICRLCNELKNANTEETLEMIKVYIVKNKKDT